MRVPNGGKVWDGNGWNGLVDDNDLQKPYPPRSSSHTDPTSTIFIGVSAFRDRRCPQTLFNYLSNAKFPERIRIGVVQQNAKDDPDCIEGYCSLMKSHSENKNIFNGECPYRQQIKVIRVDYKLATGPCSGRHLQSYMLRDEEFCMQTDSHMKVVPEWDAMMADMWGRAQNEYGILTTYVHTQESIHGLTEALDKQKLVPHLCQVMFTATNNPRYVQAKLAYKLPAPKLTTAWAAGYSFGKCHGWRAVPYDPGLKMVFDGEEFSMAARLWTRGYDFYTPDMSLIGHDYNKVKDGPAPLSWTKNPGHAELNKKGHDRLHNLLGILGKNDTEIVSQLGKYGLGNKRTFRQYQEFVGVNTTTLQILSNRCNSIAWVPFEDDWPPTENNLGGPYWENELKRRANGALTSQLPGQSRGANASFLSSTDSSDGYELSILVFIFAVVAVFIACMVRSRLKYMKKSEIRVSTYDIGITDLNA